MTEQFGPSSEQEKINQALKETQAHIGRNVIPATEGRKCVDGRYEPDTGEIARAGGDMGYVEVLLALNRKHGLGLTPEQCFDLVYDYLTKDGGSFFMHTDRHADPVEDNGTHGKKSLIGCGHCGKAADPEFAPLYQVNPDHVAQTVNYARRRQAKGDAVAIVPLEGDHAEKGTIIVDSDDYTVNAKDVDGNSMYFIYDKQRDMEHMKQLVSWLQQEKNMNVNLEEFTEMSDIQTNATLHVLAAGTPIIQVAIDEQGHPTHPQFVQFTP